MALSLQGKNGKEGLEVLRCFWKWGWDPEMLEEGGGKLPLSEERVSVASFPATSDMEAA